MAREQETRDETAERAAAAPDGSTRPEGGAATPPGGRASRLRPAFAVVAVLVAVAVAFALTSPPPPALPARVAPADPAPPGLLGSGAAFAVRAGDVVVPFDTLAVVVLPGDTLALEALYVAGEAEATASGGAIRRTGPRAWTWTAPPTPGLSQVRVADAGGEAVVLQALALTPFDHATDRIGAYEIGDYQDEPMGGDSAYDEPLGFVAVTAETRDVPVSPNFTLGDFLAKQASGWPKYVALSPHLLIKMERLLAAVNEAGVPARDLTVMSGYRTPAYNAAIGNTTVYSRHLYGDAADVFVDEDGDGRMDDLNGDGVVDQADAEWLAALADGVEAVPHNARLVGGVGIYGPAPHRGPFVHLDTRGSRVRW
ncbi:D-Ala-D-Ala carboxypeptidase family metallohydrolase [Rubrivirga litoralis]|uniref:D-Ala-D-Ala carboxypeptidase family metallohydrolase n=1 Tax=Rubrivirga litoralis TaxID=3075598 RepID=A0ABU3BNQ4_9BACT|nr:D-Ala-D-Ala carboxypeptidase family metallohydrolase [Rubrivirga sp. F394]MDT0630930.1 D-Ala-D-Ala carboxypeptidase family metallohydrolase [Rubrivirga sp. F394]